MAIPNCQYSHVTWIRKDSANYLALYAGLTKSPDAAAAAVTAFVDTLTKAHKTFQDALGPGVDLTALLRDFQNQTGIISTRHFTLPDPPKDPGHPNLNGFEMDLLAGIAGALMTEIGVGISIYQLVLDLVRLFDIKLHLRGLVFNAAATDLEELHVSVGPGGQPNLLPLERTIPGAKPIMNPLDNKNYDCVGFTTFGGIGVVSLEGYYVDIQAQRTRSNVVPVYCQYYAVLKGLAPGRNDRDHGPLRPWLIEESTVAVLAELPHSPDGVVAVLYR